MNERTWRCTECRHFVFPNYCAVKEINVDRNYDGYCDLAEKNKMEETSKVFGRFNVRIVFPGEKYGRTDSLVNDSADPLVEFYDTEHKNDTDWKRGQFVSRYYASAIAGHRQGLQLYDWIEDWRVPAQDMIKISEWIEEKLKERRQSK